MNSCRLSRFRKGIDLFSMFSYFFIQFEDVVSFISLLRAFIFWVLQMVSVPPPENVLFLALLIPVASD